MDGKLFQKRFWIIITNAVTICFLAYSYQCDGSRITVFIHSRKSIPFISFALVLVRLITFAEHVVIFNGEIYSQRFNETGSCTKQFITKQMKFYQYSLLMGYFIFPPFFIVEYIYVKNNMVMIALCIIIILQFIESLSFAGQCRSEKANKTRSILSRV